MIRGTQLSKFKKAPPPPFPGGFANNFAQWFDRCTVCIQWLVLLYSRELDLIIADLHDSIIWLQLQNSFRFVFFLF